MKTKYRHNGVYITEEEWKNLPSKINSFTEAKFYVNNSFEYISPMSGKLITTRQQRRDEMKKYGVREVDPGEYRSMLKDRGFDERRN